MKLQNSIYVCKTGSTRPKNNSAPSFAGKIPADKLKTVTKVGVPTLYVTNLMYKIINHDAGLMKAANDYWHAGLAHKIAQGHINPVEHITTYGQMLKSIGKMLYHSIF